MKVKKKQQFYHAYAVINYLTMKIKAVPPISQIYYLAFHVSSVNMTEYTFAEQLNFTYVSLILLDPR